MATQSRYVEVARHITALGAVKRALTRALPAECPGGPAAVLSLLHTHGELRMSRLSELLAVDISVTSRHVAHAGRHGWLERLPDPADGRSRLLRLTPAGQEMVAALGERAVEMITGTLANWSDDDLDALTAMLGRLRTDFGDCRISHGDLPLAPHRGDPPEQDPGRGTTDPGAADDRRPRSPAPTHA
ncbi:MarR family winged helix-turn-helix transcriptional regulator [Streptomyces sp. NBC_01497]|uniref:MarR family winged helix-turn-helix transcriptional regulator n=1 Tax=Streptomyces sp. NBC_01497 TaxID=2903885 RepID=UPI002E36ED0C|nr:MarR family winged helix-turn-helix transcriptional regulator [Streptomyces sp. NBC_01497]